MKTNFFLLISAIFIFASCSKKNSDTNTPPTSTSYLNTNAGSTWSYHTIDSSGTTPVNADYNLTSSSQDTTINSKKYHIYNYSYGGNQYANISGNDYYQFDSVPVAGGGNVERLYLKDNASVGTTWTQSFTLTIPNAPVPVPLTVSNKIVEKGISRTVNSVNYTNVIHVATTLSSSLIPAAALTSGIDSYYSPNYGLIDSKTVVHLNYLGITENVNLSTQLTSASLK